MSFDHHSEDLPPTGKSLGAPVGGGKYLSPRQVAERFGISRWRVQSMLNNEQHPLRYAIAGRVRLIPESEFKRAEVKAAMRKAVRRRVGALKLKQQPEPQSHAEDFEAFYRRVTGGR